MEIFSRMYIYFMDLRKKTNSDRLKYRFKESTISKFMFQNNHNIHAILKSTFALLISFVEISNKKVKTLDVFHITQFLQNALFINEKSYLH